MATVDAQALRLLKELEAHADDNNALVQLAAQLAAKTTRVQQSFVALLSAGENVHLAEALLDAGTSFPWEAAQNCALRTAIMVDNEVLTKRLLQLPSVRNVLTTTKPRMPKQTAKMLREREPPPDPLPMITGGPLNAQLTQLGPGCFRTMLAVVIYSAALQDTTSEALGAVLRDPLLAFDHRDGQSMQRKLDIQDALMCGLLAVLPRARGANFDQLAAHPHMTTRTVDAAITCCECDLRRSMSVTQLAHLNTNKGILLALKPELQQRESMRMDEAEKQANEEARRVKRARLE